MPKVTIHETRRIVLPLETVLDAVIEFDKYRAGTLWKCAVSETRLVDTQDARFVVTVRSPAGLGAERREFDLPTLAAAIIHYCLQARIPLPRQGRKSIKIVPEGVALSIESSASVERRHNGMAG